MVYEYWTDSICEAYRYKCANSVDMLQTYDMFMDETGAPDNVYVHETGEVPFFAFYNNNIGTGDIEQIKGLIDTYCKVFSGFLNDLEDIQEIIFVLTNYGGEDHAQFINDLKKFKVINIDNAGDGDNSGVNTLSIEIPVEAREKMLEWTRKSIFEQGYGIDPDPQNFGNSSGVALKFLYALIEEKAGLAQTEFEPSFGRFIRCLCRVNGIPIKDDSVSQIWTRTMVHNDLENAQIAQISKGIITDSTIVRNHPWVDDASAEIDELNKDDESFSKQIENMFHNHVKDNEEEDPEGDE